VGALDVVYRDDHLVAVHKPSGLLVHRSPIDRRETRFALQLTRDQIGQRVYPVHRLDKATSGLLLFALSHEAAGRLSRQFAQHTVRKAYLAVVRGYCTGEGLIDHPITDKADRFADADRRQPRPAQSAETRFRGLATAELPHAVDRYPHSRYSLVALYPRQGRRHQLRRHMKHIGHPIIGDAKYGKGVHNRFFQRHYGSDRLLLACTGIALSHPVTGESLTLQAGLEENFGRLVNSLGWADEARAALAARTDW
jgi:tRNA pseudouridine65 synthase